VGIEINTDVNPHSIPDTNPGSLLRFSMHQGMVCDNRPVGFPSEQGKLGIVHCA